jgi:hypothetical protein
LKRTAENGSTTRGNTTLLSSPLWPDTDSVAAATAPAKKFHASNPMRMNSANRLVGRRMTYVNATV